MTTPNNPSKFFITTPIYYINDRPHVGHAYSTIAADVLARYWRQKLGEDNVMFSTGTDENSKKTIEAASEAEQDITAYTEKMAAVWKTTWDTLGISYNDFVRTSEPRHITAVQDLITKIHAAGDISKGIYEGPYCFRCEAFYKDDELVDGLCPIHKKEVEIVKEDNYFFDLPKYGDQLLNLIKSGELEILPETRRNEVLSFIEQGLEKISFTRANQDIGIELPFDKTQKIYVWIEALTNYLTVAGYPEDNYTQWWNNVTHIVGKDIIKFHCIIWPAMLLSAGIGLPKRVSVTGFFTIDGEKISKSVGNVIDPVKLVEQYGNDALRYYILREIPFGTDGNFSTERFAELYDTELGNNLGNLVQRVAVMLTKYSDGKLTTYDAPTVPDVSEQIENFEFNAAWQTLQKFFDSLNARLEQEQPWKVAKEDPQKAAQILSEVAGALLAVEPVIRPLIPETAAKILTTFKDGHVDSSVGVLFPRIEKEA